jgi:hypothetical protein
MLKEFNKQLKKGCSYKLSREQAKNNISKDFEALCFINNITLIMYFS